jgi:SAM-dependent methyltransferase
MQMDEMTISAYDTASNSYAQDWRNQPAPDDMYALLKQFFREGPTLDVGCGSGRDVGWLNANGYAASGVDASEGLLREARASFPAIRFDIGVLPALSGVGRHSFQNVLCETVLMHLDPAEIAESTQTLLDILLPDGVVYISWRVTPDASVRDGNGRLYASFDKDLIVDTLSRQATILFDEESVSASSGKTVHRILAQKNASPG